MLIEISCKASGDPTAVICQILVMSLDTEPKIEMKLKYVCILSRVKSNYIMLIRFTWNASVGSDGRNHQLSLVKKYIFRGRVSLSVIGITTVRT